MVSALPDFTDWSLVNTIVIVFYTQGVFAVDGCSQGFINRTHQFYDDGVRARPPTSTKTDQQDKNLPNAQVEREPYTVSVLCCML